MSLTSPGNRDLPRFTSMPSSEKTQPILQFPIRGFHFPDTMVWHGGDSWRLPTSTAIENESGIFERTIVYTSKAADQFQATAQYTDHALTFMPLLLVLEDTVAELRTVVASARRAGFDEFEICERVIDARMFLGQAIAGKVRVPAALFIDLDRSLEAGCEVLRFRNAHPSLQAIRAVIWTLLGPHERGICKRFGAVSFVSKDDDPNVLIGELVAIIANFREAAAIFPPADGGSKPLASADIS